jgi:hypothetical protein
MTSQHHQVYVGNRAVGFVVQCKSGWWRGYSYPNGYGIGPFKERDVAEAWVREELYREEERLADGSLWRNEYERYLPGLDSGLNRFVDAIEGAP